MNELITIFQNIIAPLQGSLNWVNFVEIAIIVAVLFVMYKKFIQNTQSEKLFKGLFFLVLTWLFSEILILIDLKILGVFLKSLVAMIALSLIVIFQPELRRFLGYLGQPGFIRNTFFSAGNVAKKRENDVDIIKEIIEAVIS